MKSASCSFVERRSPDTLLYSQPFKSTSWPNWELEEFIQINWKTQSNFNPSPCKSTLPLRRTADAHCNFREIKFLCGKLKSSDQNETPSAPCQFKLSFHVLMSSQACQSQAAQKTHSFSFPRIPLVTLQMNTKMLQAEDPSATLFQRRRAGNKSILALLLLFPGLSKATKHQLCLLPREEINMKLTLSPCSILPPTCAYCFSSCVGASIFCLSMAPRR